MLSHLIKIVCLFILILGGCAKIHKNDLAYVSDPIPLDRSIESALAREFFDEGGWPTDLWWEMFEDPQLNAIVELALAQSPTIHKALALVQEAEQVAKQQRASLLPKLDLEYEQQWQYFSKNGFVRSFYPTMPSAPPIPPTDNQLDLSLYFNYEIDFFGRNRNLFKAALGKARAQSAEAKQATLILTTLIVQTYIELQTKLAKREVLKERLEERNALFELTTSRAEQGLDPVIPILVKEQNIYEVQQNILQLDKEILLDRHALSVLAGVGPDTDIAPKPMSAIFKGPVTLPSDLSSDLLARRPDLTAQIWRIEAAAKEIGAAKADFYPRVNLMAFAQLESLNFNQLFNISSKQGGLVPAVHLPIFTGGKLKANLKEKLAAFNEATYRYNELLLNAAKEVVDQIAILSTTFDSLNFQIHSLETAQDQFTLEFSRYKNGVNDYLAVLEREDNLLSQRYLLLSYERDYLLAVLTMIKALGGGYHASYGGG
jgi:NodT family efflux transporter outer membrane factor (OMF) lipoprotein